jgi:hypothetical protein
MIEFLRSGPVRIRVLAAVGVFILLLQWWLIPRLPEEVARKWFWALSASRSFPAWFQLVFPLLLILAPVSRLAGALAAIARLDPSHLFKSLVLSVCGISLFWWLRVRCLELGDAELIMEHFVSLTTYASIREPLESVTHTDFARLLFHAWGIHPQVSFQVLTCLWGGFILLLGGLGLARWNPGKESFLGWTGFLFLVGPAHLFFGYIEWYTQLAVGLILFEVYGIRAIVTGRGIAWALAGFVLACCSHLVGFGFLPAALVLILISLEPSRRWKVLLTFGVLAALAVVGTFIWINRHIKFGYSARTTATLFSTLLPFMRPDNPNNPPGSWHYYWLSPNHLSDLANEILFCAYFPLTLLVSSCARQGILRRIREAAHIPQLLKAAPGDLISPKVILFLIPQLALGLLFLLLWNPWLGFPGDWDLFSFFTWPLLAASLAAAYAWVPRDWRRSLCGAAGIPAFSMIFAWVVFHHHGSLPSRSEILATLRGDRVDYCLNEARQARLGKNWPAAFEFAESLMRADPGRTEEALSIFSTPVIQEMADEWPDKERFSSLAADFEILSASPVPRLLVMDCWGRLFVSEGGCFNQWSMQAIPGIPEHHAVAMEIVPWRGAAVILRDDGALYEVPVASWVAPHPTVRRQTHFQAVPSDRTPRPVGNLWEDYAGIKMHIGARAVDLAADHHNRRLVAIDSSGDVVADAPGVDWKERKIPFVCVDLELYWDGGTAYLTDWFGGVTGWPGDTFPINTTGLSFKWPAICDLEMGLGGSDAYFLDVQGGVHAFSSVGEPFIDTGQMNHYSTHGELEEYCPYISEPVSFFKCLELVPNEHAYYRMNRNFGIFFSEQAGLPPG